MCKIFKKKSKFRTGSNFTSEEKRLLLMLLIMQGKNLMKIVFVDYVIF